MCPLGIVFGDRPICGAIVHLIEAQTVRYLQIRLHNDTTLLASLDKYPKPKGDFTAPLGNWRA